MGWVRGGISVIYAIIPGICLFVKISRYRRVCVCVHVRTRVCVCMYIHVFPTLLLRVPRMLPQ